MTSPGPCSSMAASHSCQMPNVPAPTRATSASRAGPGRGTAQIHDDQPAGLRAPSDQQQGRCHRPIDHPANNLPLAEPMDCMSTRSAVCECVLMSPIQFGKSLTLDTRIPTPTALLRAPTLCHGAPAQRGRSFGLPLCQTTQRVWLGHAWRQGRRTAPHAAGVDRAHCGAGTATAQKQALLFWCARTQFTAEDCGRILDHIGVDSLQTDSAPHTRRATQDSLLNTKPWW